MHLIAMSSLLYLLKAIRRDITIFNNTLHIEALYDGGGIVAMTQLRQLDNVFHFMYLCCIFLVYECLALHFGPKTM